MVEGVLEYNQESERYGIIDNMDLWANEGLHCGEVLQVLIHGQYIEMGIEMSISNKWYLTDYERLLINNLDGLQVKKK